MIQKSLKYIVAMLTAAVVGFAFVHFGMGDFFGGARTETQLELTVRIRGNNDVPVSNAQLSLLFPQGKPSENRIGSTNRYGNHEVTILVPSGKVTTLQATGPSFRILKDIFIPRVARLKMQVFLDPTEAKLGHMNLMTRNLERFNSKIQTKLSKQAPEKKAFDKKNPEKKALEGTTKAPADLGSHVMVDILPSSSNSTPPLVAEHKPALIAAVVRHNALLKNANVRKVVMRLASQEGPYFELIAWDGHKNVVASTLVKMTAARKAPFDIAMKRLTRPVQRGDSAALGRLMVKTSAPEKTRAYLNGVALPRKLKKESVTFDFSAWQSVPDNKKAILTVTSEDGPFIRTQLKSPQLKRKIRWTLPETQLSRR